MSLGKGFPWLKTSVPKGDEGGQFCSPPSTAALLILLHLIATTWSKPDRLELLSLCFMTSPQRPPSMQADTSDRSTGRGPSVPSAWTGAPTLSSDHDFAAGLGASQSWSGISWDQSVQ